MINLPQLHPSPSQNLLSTPHPPDSTDRSDNDSTFTTTSDVDVESHIFSDADLEDRDAMRNDDDDDEDMLDPQGADAPPLRLRVPDAGKGVGRLLLALSQGRVLSTVGQVEELARERHRERRLGAYERVGRSQHAYYWKLLLLLGLYYAIPASQWMIWQYRAGVSEGFDQPGQECYFNFRCARPLLGLYNFNNILSNSLYVLLGLLFMLGVFLDRRTWASSLGLDPDASLYYALGTAIAFEGLFSAIYHVCPSATNFQFDTTFMIVSGGLLLLAVYAKRHHAIIPPAASSYAWMFVFIVLNMLSLARSVPSPLFWLLSAAVVVSLNLRASLIVYHPVSAKGPLQRIAEFFRLLRRCQGPRRRKRFAFFVFCNVVVLLLCLAPLTFADASASSDTRSFPVLMLAVLVVSWIMYFFWYVFMKTIYTRVNPDEGVPLISLVFICLTVACWVVAVYFFKIPTANKFLTWEESKELNADCVLFDYFDTHDIWHFMSALALFFQLMSMYTVDRKLRHTNRAIISVF